MKMTPAILIIGALLIFWASTFTMVFLPMATMEVKPSAIWRPMNSLEKEGFHLYVVNGCSYCHTLYVRVNDWQRASQRITEAGDYVGMEPTIPGTERTGPDLSQEGGEHPDDWHVAHFKNPRYTSPISLMPSWEFLGDQDIARLIAFMQYLGHEGRRCAHGATEKLEATGDHSIPVRRGREYQVAAQPDPRCLEAHAEPLSGRCGVALARERGSSRITASTATGRSATARVRRQNS